MNADKHSQSVEQAPKDMLRRCFAFWAYTCPHDMHISYQWECPACAREVIARLRRKLAAYQFAAKVRRTCGKRDTA